VTSGFSGWLTGTLVRGSCHVIGPDGTDSQADGPISPKGEGYFDNGETHREEVRNSLAVGDGGRSLVDMSNRSDNQRFLLWPRLKPLVRACLLAALPVPDLISRYQVRRAAAKLVTCDPWPGTAALGTDAAQLAVLRLRLLQRETRRAVRRRQYEAATMLARASIEALIIGLYCLHEPDAVTQLEGENVRNMPLLLEFFSDAGMIPGSVLAECIKGLRLGEPAKGPTMEVMARRIDAAMGGSTAVGLYKRFYRPTSTFAVHTGAASLMRHVRADDSISCRPQRTWARRSPVRIADASLGLLTAAVAQRAGSPCQEAIRYVNRHGDRALAPVLVMGTSGLMRTIRPWQLLAIIRQMRSYGEYIWSWEDAEDPEIRMAKIRAGMKSLLLLLELGIPPESMDPFLDYIAAEIAADVVPSPQ
jgi:hypothetical protein